LNNLKVTCYSGHTYAERPKSFELQSREYEVKEIKKAWQEPGKKLFTVVTNKGEIFELCYNKTENYWSAIEVVI